MPQEMRSKTAPKVSLPLGYLWLACFLCSLATMFFLFYKSSYSMGMSMRDNSWLAAILTVVAIVSCVRCIGCFMMAGFESLWLKLPFSITKKIELYVALIVMLAFGIIFITYGLKGLSAGEIVILAKGGHIVSGTTSTKLFWTLVTTYLILGAFFITAFLHLCKKHIFCKGSL